MLRTFSALFALLLAQAGCLFTDAASTQGESASSGSSDVGDDSGDDGEDDGSDDGDDGDGDDGGEDDGDDGDDGGDRDDCKAENQDIGETVSIELGSVTVTLTDWLAKDDSPGEYVGFTLQLEGADTISYRVKAGGQVFSSSELSWSHPNGTSGPEVPGISNVDFCDDDDGDDDGGGDDGGGDDDGGDHGDDGGGDHGDDGGDDDGGDVVVD
jgi:hypothetical protein